MDNFEEGSTIKSSQFYDMLYDQEASVNVEQVPKNGTTKFNEPYETINNTQTKKNNIFSSLTSSECSFNPVRISGDNFYHPNSEGFVQNKYKSFHIPDIINNNIETAADQYAPSFTEFKKL